MAVHDHPSNCQSGGVIRMVSTFSQVGSVPKSVKESIGGGEMDFQLTMDQMQLTQAQLFLDCLAWAFVPKLTQLIQSFNSWLLF